MMTSFGPERIGLLGRHDTPNTYRSYHTNVSMSSSDNFHTMNHEMYIYNLLKLTEIYFGGLSWRLLIL